MELSSLTSDSTELSPSRTLLSHARPLLSIVVPTKNEAGNVADLIARLEAVVPTVAMEIIFVDASTDATPEFIEEIAPRCTREVVLLRQTRERGRSGLAARSPWTTAAPRPLRGLRGSA